MREPVLNYISAKERQRQHPYATRKSKGYVVRAPVDIVEVDILGVSPLDGMAFKHFIARDFISRWDIFEAHGRISSRNVSEFINTMLERMSFPIKAIQVDGGSEFQDVFERECQRRGIRLFVLPPCSSRLNGHVEREQRTPTEEFYELTDSSFEIEGMCNAVQPPVDIEISHTKRVSWMLLSAKPKRVFKNVVRG